MSRFIADTSFTAPGLHLWREGTDTKLWLKPVAAPAGGRVEFDYDFEPEVLQDVRFMLFEFNARGEPAAWEPSEHQRKLPRVTGGGVAPEVWFSQGAARVLTADPRLQTRTAVRIHLISARRYRPSELFLWQPHGAERRVPASGEDALGPVFDVALTGLERSFFLFKFVRRETTEGPFDRFEPTTANRLWHAADGDTIWVHSDVAEIARAEPHRQRLRVHCYDPAAAEPRLYFWQDNAEFSADAGQVRRDGDWRTFELSVYAHLAYGFRFCTREADATTWEHEEAKRRIVITQDEEVWTLAGDRQIFRARPQRNQRVELMITARPPACTLAPRLFAHVWINRARVPLHAKVSVSANGRVAFTTFPEVVTAVKFFDATGGWENLDRHTFVVPASATVFRRHVVLERPPLLMAPLPADRFADPPFAIRRPGHYAEGDVLRFVVHAPQAARVRLVGDWTHWDQQAIEMTSTRGGTYWWATVRIADLLNGLGRTTYHGAEYCFLINDAERLQDPAAGWVNSSWSRQGRSRLIDPAHFSWTDQAWHRPGWEYLNIYQIHVARFTPRHAAESPLARVRREIESQAGYLRGLGITALLLMPLNEVGTQNSWGYDPAYFYAIEESFGGPDALKELVDTCHAHGLAVIIDVVFNHAGSTDNILWEYARETYFDGDTKWGAMINFDHPQCRHFFAQNLVYLAQEYHLDGFRLDHTATIVHSHVWDAWSSFVAVRGSGGGWEFLHALRFALEREVGANCLLMAEHLPNEWPLTNFGGPMDTQWSDDFHDRLVDACRRELYSAPRLAAAMELSHTACSNWYGVTNYPESHDEVGNVRDRVAFVAGFGQGWRMAKVAAAATLLARGIPMTFMGTEAGEDQQFEFGGTSSLDLHGYETQPDRSRIRAWWRVLSEWRRGNATLQGPAPLRVCHAEGQCLCFTRGDGPNIFVVLNFGGATPSPRLGELGLPSGVFREQWNSTWPAFAIGAEQEGEHANGGRDARLTRDHTVNVPDYGVLVLERV